MSWYNELRQDIETDLSLTDAQRTEDLASLGNLSDFVAGIREDTVAPFLNRLQSRGFQSRSNLSQNVLDRSRFLLSTATSQDEFDSERTGLVRATNDYYDLEEDRISNLMSSEQELQNLREDNALARIRTLRDIDQLEFRSADSQLDDIRLGSARSQEDLNRNFQRSIEDIDPGFFTQGSGRVTSAGGFTNALRGIIDNTDPAYRSNENILSQLSEQFGVSFATNNLGTGQFTQGLLPLIKQFTRGSEDLAIDAGRQEQDFLSQLAAEESNNLWKSQIAEIAANTAQMDMLDPMLPPDLDPMLPPDLDPMLPPDLDPNLMSSEGNPPAPTPADDLLTTTQLDDPLSSFSIQLAQASKSLNTAGIDMIAAASVVRQGGSDLSAAAAHLRTLSIPAVGGGRLAGPGGFPSDNQLLAQNDRTTQLTDATNITPTGGGGNGGGGV